MPENKDDIDLEGWDLFGAARKNRADIARALIENGADLKRTDDEGNTLLHLIADIHWGESWSQSYPGDYDRHDKKKKENCLEFLRLLVKNNVEINAKNSDGSTPLRIAAITDFFEASKLLISNGADVQTRTFKQETLLCGLIHRSYLFKSGRRFLNMLRLLIENGADVNASSLGGWGEKRREATPLHWTALGVLSRVDLARLLIDNHADVRARDAKGQTPLHYAAKSDHGSIELMSLLIEQGAEVNARDVNGVTPLHFFSETVLKQRAKSVETHDEQIDDGVTDWERWYRENQGMARLLIEKGANIEGIDHSWVGHRYGAQPLNTSPLWDEELFGTGFVETNDSTEKPSKEPFSHSRLSTFEKCQKEYWYKYIEKQPDLYDSIEAFAGTIAHETVEWMYQRKDEMSIPTETEVSTKYNDIWEKQEKTTNKEIRTIKKETPPDHHRQQMEKAVLNYYSRKFLSDRSQTLVLEGEFEMDLGTEAYTGKIDRVAKSGSQITIIDYKSRQSKYEKIAQLRGYGTLYMEKHEEVQSLDIVFEYLVNGTNRRETMTRQDASQVKQKLKERISKTRGISNFPAEPGILCLWCSYNTMCNEFQSSEYNQIKLNFQG